MTTAADLLALALRVEREESSVNLDRAVWQAVGGKPENSIWDDYTSSLDAAASLMSDKWHVVEICSSFAYNNWSVRLSRKKLSMRPDADGNAKTEPQARTAAALRAMAQEARDE